MNPLRALGRSFRWAFRGFIHVLCTERNMRIHLAATFYVIFFGCIAALSVAHWTAVLLCCALVMALECGNTAVETLCDRVTRSKDDAIRIAKDAAAGAVLIAACFSVAIAALLAAQPVYRANVRVWFSGHPAGSVVLAATVPLFFYLIFYKRSKI